MLIYLHKVLPLRLCTFLLLSIKTPATSIPNNYCFKLNPGANVRRTVPSPAPRHATHQTAGELISQRRCVAKAVGVTGHTPPRTTSPCTKSLHFNSFGIRGDQSGFTRAIDHFQYKKNRLTPYT